MTIHESGQTVVVDGEYEELDVRSLMTIYPNIILKAGQQFPETNLPNHTWRQIG